MLLILAHPASEAMKTGSLWIVLMLTVIPAAIANGCYVSSVSELFFYTGSLYRAGSLRQSWCLCIWWLCSLYYRIVFIKA